MSSASSSVGVPPASSGSSSPSVSVSTSSSGVRVAIVGCGHGELDKMYECVDALTRDTGRAIDLLLCCGDFQSVRNYEDLACMACPQKYRKLNTFYKYYTGEKKAPVLTIFIGGNHEASNYLVELFHGGWVAPNIYYLGFGGVVEFGGLRIGGLSGIFNDRHFRQGHHEHAPFDNDSQRSVYHVREYDVWQLMQYERAAATAAAVAASAAAGTDSAVATPVAPTPIDIFMSHDWPRNIAHHGNTSQLLRQKKFLASEVADGSLGSPPAERLLQTLRPRYWFSAHLHVKFPAVVRHPDAAGAQTGDITQFLALDKCLPHREYMQLLDFPHATGPKVLAYDPTWLAIVRATHPFLSLQRHARPIPQARDGQPFAPTADELAWVRANVPRAADGRHEVPLNFVATAPGWTESMGHDTRGVARQPPFVINPQTRAFLDMLQLPDVLTPAFSGQQQQGGRGPMNQMHQQPPPPMQAGFPSPIAHASKKQRTDGIVPIPLAAAVHTNPDEIDLDALDAAEPASNDAPATAAGHNPDEITLDEADDEHTTAPTGNAGNPDEISIDDL